MGWFLSVSRHFYILTVNQPPSTGRIMKQLGVNDSWGKWQKKQMAGVVSF
jgi:hypothetical protein